LCQRHVRVPYCRGYLCVIFSPRPLSTRTPDSKTSSWIPGSQGRATAQLRLSGAARDRHVPCQYSFVGYLHYLAVSVSRNWGRLSTTRGHSHISPTTTSNILTNSRWESTTPVGALCPPLHIPFIHVHLLISPHG
jgi:hypothetical protein